MAGWPGVGVGWGLAEALEELASDEELLILRTALSALMAHGDDRYIDITEFKFSKFLKPGSAPPPKRENSAPGESVLDHFIDCCRGKGQIPRTLIAYGTPMHPPGPRRKIETWEWQEITHFCLGLSRIGDAAGPIFKNVSVFPVLFAPNVDEELFGFSLWDLVNCYVLDDPQILKAYWPLYVAGRPMPPTLRKLLASKQGSMFRMPLIWGERALADGLDFLDHEFPRERILRTFDTATVMASRLAALGYLLASGKVAVVGIGSDATETVIPPARFKSADLRLCLATGNIWEERNGEKTPLFQAVVLERPQEGARRTAPKNNGGRPSTDLAAAVAYVRSNDSGAYSKGTALVAAVKERLDKMGTPLGTGQIKGRLKAEFPADWERATGRRCPSEFP